MLNSPDPLIAMTLLCWGFNSHAKSQNLNQGYGYMKIFKTEQRKLKFDKGGYWPKSIIPNLLSVKEQPKNQESEVHMGKHWKSFLGAVKNRQKHVNTRRFIYLLQYFWKKPWETETKRVGHVWSSYRAWGQCVHSVFCYRLGFTAPDPWHSMM